MAENKDRSGGVMAEDWQGQQGRIME